MTDQARKQFLEANRLWFDEGATGRALSLYESAARALPGDPVIACQLACVQWAVGRYEDAAVTSARAEEHRDRLTPFGRTLLRRTRERLASPPRQPLPIGPSEMDIEVLERRDLTPAQWLDIAFAAQDRDMFGLAAQAFPRSTTFQSAELDREEHEARQSASTWRQALDAQAVQEGPASPSGGEGQSPETVPTVGAPTSAPPIPARRTVHPPSTNSESQVRASSPSVDRGAQRTPRLGTPLLLSASVQPPASSTADPIELEVALLNRGERPVAINGRLLLNSPEAPPGFGELALSVEGPPGYASATRFSVRAGRAGPESFVALAPGEEIRRNYRLLNYESLHVPGHYTVWVTYRNEIPGWIGNLRAFVGAMSSDAVPVERRADVPGQQAGPARHRD